MSDESTETKIVADTKSKASDGAVFTKEYVEDLREEAKSVRQKLADYEKSKNDELSTKENEFKTLLEQKVTEVSDSYKKELMLTKVQIEAVKAGIIDMDGVKLADFSKVSFDKDNNLVGANELIEELKKSKGYLFKKTDKTTFEKEMPGKSSDTKIDVRNMSKEEYQKHKFSLLKQK